MKNILQYLYSTCECESQIKESTNELWFRMPHEYWIVITLSDLFCLYDENLENDIPFSIDELDIDRISNIKITDVQTIKIYSGEIIDKEDCCIPTKPYTYIAEYINREICTKFPNSILSYITKEYCTNEECYGCPEVIEYGSIFDINTHDFSISYVQCIDNIYKSIQNIGIPSFYNINREPKDNHNIKILPSNTKARRLGYLKVLLSMFSNVDRIPINTIATKFESLSVQYKESLLSHKNNKGEIIITKTGASAKPYIDLAEKLGLINKITGYYTLGKEGRIYNALINDVNVINESIFSFNSIDTPYLLELILREDFLYISTILRLLYKEREISYDRIRMVYQAELINQCTIYSINENLSFSERHSIKSQILKIKGWKKSLTYIEHIIMPRVNWLYDMNVIYINNTTFSLTASGRLLYYNLSIWDDVNKTKVISPQWYIDNFFMKLYDIAVDCRANRFNVDLNREVLQKYIDRAFVLFKSLAPNRVTFSLLAKYVKYMLYLEHKLAIDTDDIKELFSTLEFAQYIFKYQNQYNDGYIQIR